MKTRKWRRERDTGKGKRGRWRRENKSRGEQGDKER